MAAAAVKDQSLELIQTYTQRYRTAIRLVLILVVGILLIMLILKIVRLAKKPANATYVTGGGEIPSGWDPTAMTDELFNMIDGTLEFAGTMQEIYKKFNQLNDNQKVAVYNKWLDKDYDQVKKYFMFPLGTLTQAIKEKVGYAWPGQNEKTLAEINLDRLHLA